MRVRKHGHDATGDLVEVFFTTADGEEGYAPFEAHGSYWEGTYTDPPEFPWFELVPDAGAVGVTDENENALRELALEQWIDDWHERTERGEDW